jgi:hypothetical protein
VSRDCSFEEVPILDGKYVFSVSKTDLDTDRILLYFKQV